METTWDPIRFMIAVDFPGKKSLILTTFFYKVNKILEQAGAEHCQAQISLKLANLTAKLLKW